MDQLRDLTPTVDATRRQGRRTVPEATRPIENGFRVNLTRLRTGNNLSKLMYTKGFPSYWVAQGCPRSLDSTCDQVEMAGGASLRTPLSAGLLIIGMLFRSTLAGSWGGWPGQQPWAANDQ